MARTHREVAIEGMLGAVEEAMCQVIDCWGRSTAADERSGRAVSHPT